MFLFFSGFCPAGHHTARLNNDLATTMVRVSMCHSSMKKIPDALSLCHFLPTLALHAVFIVVLPPVSHTDSCIIFSNLQFSVYTATEGSGTENVSDGKIASRQ